MSKRAYLALAAAAVWVLSALYVPVMLCPSGRECLSPERPYWKVGYAFLWEVGETVFSVPAANEFIGNLQTAIDFDRLIVEWVAIGGAVLIAWLLIRGETT